MQTLVNTIRRNYHNPTIPKLPLLMFIFPNPSKCSIPECVTQSVFKQVVQSLLHHLVSGIRNVFGPQDREDERNGEAIQKAHAFLLAISGNFLSPTVPLFISKTSEDWGGLSPQTLSWPVCSHSTGLPAPWGGSSEVSAGLLPFQPLSLLWLPMCSIPSRAGDLELCTACLSNSNFSLSCLSLVLPSVPVPLKLYPTCSWAKCRMPWQIAYDFKVLEYSSANPEIPQA